MAFALSRETKWEWKYWDPLVHTLRDTRED